MPVCQQLPVCQLRLICIFINLVHSIHSIHSIFINLVHSDIEFEMDENLDGWKKQSLILTDVKRTVRFSNFSMKCTFTWILDSSFPLTTSDLQ